MTQTTELLESRYGKKSSGRRYLIIGAVSAVAIVFFSFAIYASFIGKPMASVQLTSYEQIDANHIRGNFTALTGNQAASCVFKASNAAGAIVGYSEVEIPAHNSDGKALSIVVKTVMAASVLSADECSVK
jgi:hypothetical protein